MSKLRAPDALVFVMSWSMKSPLNALFWSSVVAPVSVTVIWLPWRVFPPVPSKRTKLLSVDDDGPSTLSVFRLLKLVLITERASRTTLGELMVVMVATF